MPHRMITATHHEGVAMIEYFGAIIYSARNDGCTTEDEAIN